jgi:guanosine-3',5'-bis(diphosphate) 3'-pyrophosphohydrolase
MTSKNNYYSITLQSQYKTLYKELLELNEPTETLSQAVRLMIKINTTNSSYKAALIGLETFSLLIKHFRPSKITTFISLLSEYSLQDLEKNKTILQPLNNEIITHLEMIKGLEEFCTKSIIDNELKINHVRSVLFENEHLTTVGFIKFAQITNKINTLSSEAKNSFCYLAKNFFIPTAHKLKLIELKTKFEDCCMEIENPQEYIRVLKGMVNQLEPMKHAFMKQFCKGLNKKLRVLGVPIKFTYRLKGVKSIWNKLQSQNLFQEELHDYIGVRAIIKASPENEIELCNRAYEIVKSCYVVDHSKTRHWLVEPKESGYQALHVTIIDRPKTMIEIQIKSKNMHEIAENGAAAHWLYKKDLLGPESKLQKLIVEDLRKVLREE